jgi:predicted dehydrogenase
MAPDCTRRLLLQSAIAAALVPRGAHTAVRLAFAGGARNREAAQAAGFETVAAGFEAALADRSIGAVAISTSLPQRARMAMDACRAGKDVWVEAPVCASLEEGRRMVESARRYGRVVQGGTFWRSSRRFREARRAVRGGELGGIVFCRMFEGRESGCAIQLVDLLQGAFEEAVPARVAAQGSGGNGLAILHYPGFVASYERRGSGPAGIAFHGATATLLIGPPDDGARVAHWRDFLECIRRRRRPVSDIATGVRSSATHSLAKLAMRRGTTVSFEEEV